MVEQHYSNLGFEKMDGVESAQYVLDVDSYRDKECYIVKA